MALTYEQLAPALYKQARKLCGNISGFQVHELINACWLMGEIQKLESINFAQARAKYDMLDYIRRETGSRPKQNATRKSDALRNKGSNEHVLQNHDHANPTVKSLQTVLWYDKDGEYLLQDDIPGKIDAEPENIDAKDLFDRLCRGLNRQESLILKLRFLEDFEMKKIGIVIGVCESRVSQMLANLLPRIRVILKNLRLTEKVNNRREGHKPQFKRDARDVAEYQHNAYLRRRKLAYEARSRKRHALAV